MPNRVAAEGSRSARIVLIGEAPGHWEDTYGRPFVGPSFTDKLLPWWNDCTPKLTREMFFITNVLDYQPTQIGKVPEHEIRAGMERVHQEIAALDDPFVIVPTGNYALYCVTGNGRVSFHSRDGNFERPGIQDWRGSILSYADRRGRQIKVIPTVHPASTFRQGHEWFEMPCRMDWQRIAEDQLFRELRLPERQHMIGPSKAEAIEWIRWTRAEAEKRKHGRALWERLACSLDVETPYKAEYEVRQDASESKAAKCTGCGHGMRWHATDGVAERALPTCTKRGLKADGALPCPCAGYVAPMNAPRRVKISEEAYLGCIGYSWNGILALCVPTTLEYWQDPVAFATIMAELRAFHADPNIDFGGQNFTFDAWWCAEEKVPVRPAWDLMKMHRVQRPAHMKHSLEYQASLDTREPYWKHESKLPSEVSRWSHNKAQLWDYNCTDNRAQLTLLFKRLHALEAGGRLEYYHDMEASMDAPLLELSLRGVRVNVPAMVEERERVLAESLVVAEELNTAAGMKIIGNTAVSPLRMQKFLYGDGQVTPVYERPMVAVESAMAKCTVCNHPRSQHATFDTPPDPGVTRLEPCTKRLPKKDGGALCPCVGFVAPLKPGKRVKVSETTSGGLRLPPQMKKVKKDGTIKKVVTTDIVALKRLMDQYPTLTQLQTVGAKALKHRRLMKVAGFLNEKHVDADSRWRALFKQDTLLGRLSSSETPKDKGANLQNIDRSLRRFFVADTGKEAA